MSQGFWGSSELVLKGRSGRKGGKGRQKEKKKSDGTRKGEFLSWGEEGKGEMRGKCEGKGEGKKGWAGKTRVRQKGARTELRNQVGRGREEGAKSRWEVKKGGKRRKGLGEEINEAEELPWGYPRQRLPLPGLCRGKDVPE